MKHITTKPLPEDCDIALMGDAHIGTAFAHMDGIQSAIDWVAAEENRYFCHIGDAIEAIVTDDKRFQSAGSTQPIPAKQRDFVIDLFAPVKERGLTWLLGNHEWSLMRFGDLADEMATGLGIPYGTTACKLTLMSERGPMCKFYLRHKTRSRLVSNAKDYEQQQANMKASLKMNLVNQAADCCLMAAGHAHKLLIVAPAPKLYMNSTPTGKLRQNYLKPCGRMSDYIEPDCRFYACTGSFLRQSVEGISGYAEMAGYDPVELGYVVANIRGGTLVSLERVTV